MKRREFINLSFMAGGGLVLGLNYSCLSNEKEYVGKGEKFLFNPFVEISDNGIITIYAPIPELGQGVRTALPMILAEELDADWEQIVVEQAISGNQYGKMVVAGSTSVSRFYEPLRKAGATVKMVLKTVASQKWNVSINEIKTEKSFAINTLSGKKLSYSELAEAASQLRIPETVPLKKVSEFKIIGKARKSIDLLNIVTGKAVYGLDAIIEGMKYVAIERCPVRGGTLLSFNEKRALAVDGVIKVIPITPYRPIPYAEVLPGVAVIANSTSAAMKGKALLSVDWDYGETEKENSLVYRENFNKLKNKTWEYQLRETSNYKSKVGTDDEILDFEYEIPFWAHYCMEPMNFTAHFSETECLLKGPNQRPQLIQDLVSQIYKIPLEKVTVESTLAGGGFGRRLAVDYALEALMVSKESGLPVKVVWTREDDVLHDYFRSISFHHIKIGLKNSNLNSWYHHIMTKPIGDGPIYEVQGAADLPFNIPNIAIGYSKFPTNIQIGSWRSVAHTYNSFVVNNTITEVAAHLGEDPLKFYISLMQTEDTVTVTLPLRGSRGSVVCDMKRLRAVLMKAAELSTWNKSNRTSNSAMGLACAFYKTSYTAHVVEVENKDGKIKLKKITAVLDCGKIINPLGVRAQIEGSISDAITVALKSNITIENGQPQEINFDMHPVTRLQDMPELQLHVMDSNEDPSGAGEPPFPSVAPAIANAIFRLTGNKIRKLPISI
tara:strand:+ start:246 stop:2411 length:2166 start_codon:yes stop_codon:yes gene_type:complete